MRPSSSRSDDDSGPSDREPSGCGGTGLFAGVLAAGPVAGEVTDRAWLQALLDVEAALARAQSRVGLIPPQVAAEITQVCHVGRFDPHRLGAEAAATGTPVVPLLRALRSILTGPAAEAVHLGATSQDIVDSAAMLVASRALGPLVGDLAASADRLAHLAARHRDTVVSARTLLQQALPTTFGLVAAGWLTAVDGVVDRLTRIREQQLAVQLGGAAGTLAALGPTGLTVVGLLAQELGLAAPALPWHTDRSRIADLAGALGTAAGVIGKVAGDIVLYAQTEVAEVREAPSGDSGESSTLPHKHNPIAAISAAAGAAQAPGLVATLLAAMPHEYQRAAGAWHAEWRPLSSLLESAGSAGHWLRISLESLSVDADRMRANAGITGGALLAERVSGALTPLLGRRAARDLVRAAAERSAVDGRPLVDTLAAQASVSAHLSREQLTDLLTPGGYLGSAGTLTDRALHAHRARVGWPQ